MSRRTSRAAGAAVVAPHAVLVWIALGAGAAAGDWPQILGPGRSGAAAADERLADAWPAGGPREVWRRDVGAGVAGVAVVGDRGFLFHRVGDRELLEAFDTATGATVWSDGHALGTVGYAADQEIGLPLKKSTTMVVLAENLGRLAGGAALGEPKGLFGAVWECEAIKLAKITAMTRV